VTAVITTDAVAASAFGTMTAQGEKPSALTNSAGIQNEPGILSSVTVPAGRARRRRSWTSSAHRQRDRRVVVGHRAPDAPGGQCERTERETTTPMFHTRRRGVDVGMCATTRDEVRGETRAVVTP
jgi:hypothetical protein